MKKRGSAIDFVLTAEQFEDLLKTAAAIEDREKSIECFCFILLMGRYGLRAGELVHFAPGWVDTELPALRIPSYTSCDCGYCMTAAERRLEDDATEEEREEVAAEYWSPKSSNGARPIVLDTERAQKAVDRYFRVWGTVKVSYSTIYRRVVKVAEYTDSVDASELTPQVLRATAATYWASRGMPPAVLQALMGWHDPSVAEYYVAISGAMQQREMLQIRGRDPEDAGLAADPSPATWSDLRPTDVSSRFEVERWDLREQSVPAHPRQSEEEAIEETILDEFGADGRLRSALPAAAAYHLAVQSAGDLEERARRERRALQYDDDFATPDLRHCAGVFAMCAVAATVLAVVAALEGGSFVDPTTLPRSFAALPIGAAYAAWDLNIDEP